MTAERRLSTDGDIPFIATSLLNGRASMDKKPRLARLSIEESGSATVLKIAESRPADHSTPPSSGSATATMSPAASDPCGSTEPVLDDPVCWNLVPYDVPWGQDYFNYKQGTLPGPDGKCLFLRSPTPVEKRRTSQACKMCRERKAKCSGDRPSCARCVARGYICQYLPETKKIKPARTGPIRLKMSRSLSHPYSRRDSDTLSIASSTDFSEYSSYSSSSSSSSCHLSPKQEDEEFPSAVLLHNLQLQYPDADDQKEEASTADSAYLPPFDYAREPSQDSSVHEPPPPSATSTTSSLSFWSGYESPHPQTQALAPVSSFPTFHAPRPLRYSQSLPFLPSLERRISCPADVINRPRSAEPVVEVALATTVDPRVLTQQQQPADVVYYPVQDELQPQVQVADPQATHWVPSHTAPEQYAVAVHEGAMLMQQYCNVSPIAPYAQSHPMEEAPAPHAYDPAAPPPQMMQVPMLLDIPPVPQQHYVPSGYDFSSYASAAPTFA
ncbi:hypothetical protein EIP91_000529 [Steccherinum ochraceum]|uniref:Zn(2)-C6 fungal-type domain-containing protein n=1 Tax=Steccherinum ochraceum TaxID=92696 RepID=A0A4R0RQ70_9APHY|nr:hypothetical protein EIP91_000529 [Steccherinum ochraceum]